MVVDLSGVIKMRCIGSIAIHILSYLILSLTDVSYDY